MIFPYRGDYAAQRFPMLHTIHDTLETDEKYYPELKSDAQRSLKMRSPKQGSKSEKGEEFYAQKRSLKQGLDLETDEGSILKKSIKEDYSPMECSVNLSYVESMNESSKYLLWQVCV